MAVFVIHIDNPPWGVRRCVGCLSIFSSESSWQFAMERQYTCTENYPKHSWSPRETYRRVRH